MKNLLVVAALILAPSVSFGSTVTLTFDDLPSGGDTGPREIVEKGVTIGGYSSSFESKSVHIDDGGTSWSDYVDFSTGAKFDILSVDILGLGQELYRNDTPKRFKNVLFEGFRNGMLVRSWAFSTGLRKKTFTRKFGGRFIDLDLFKISANRNYSKSPRAHCIDSPCGHFSVDNVVVRKQEPSPVPLPGSLPMLAVGFAGFGIWARKRTKRTADV